MKPKYVITTTSSYGLRAGDLRVFGDYESMLDYIRNYDHTGKLYFSKRFRIYEFKEYGGKPKNIKWAKVEKDIKKPGHIRKWEKKLKD